MRRTNAMLAAGLALMAAAIVISLPVYAQGGEENDLAPLRGAAVYAEFCQACHGPRGEAIGDGPAFAAITFSAETVQGVIVQGIDSDPDNGVAMPGYGELLQTDQVDDLIAYMKTWETDQTPPLPEPNLTAAVDMVETYPGDPQTGASVYARFCYGCHGAEGHGREAPDFPGFEPSAKVLLVVNEGHGINTVPTFAESAGGPLSSEQVQDLDAYIASWRLAKPSEDKNDTPEGMSVLVVLFGLLMIAAVGGFYWSRRQ